MSYRIVGRRPVSDFLDQDRGAYEYDQWIKHLKEKQQPVPFKDTDSHNKNRYRPPDDPQAEWEEAMTDNLPQR